MMISFLAIILLLEILVLVLVKWVGFSRVLLTALIINLISTIIDEILVFTLWYWKLW
ncbi:MAG: hypothetical protein IBX69_13365 [Anaerolineales bacterium]|nr:hypothetical protein [Anaerolineales bacterium]